MCNKEALNESMKQLEEENKGRKYDLDLSAAREKYKPELEECECEACKIHFTEE